MTREFHLFARIAQAIQADLEKIGIIVDIVERDAATGRAAARAGKVDLFLADWYADYPDAENFTYPLFHSSNAGSGGNYAFLKGILPYSSGIIADEGYLTESMIDPRAKIVKGYKAVMPTYRGKLTAPDSAALVEFIKSLRSENLENVPSKEAVYEPIRQR